MRIGVSVMSTSVADVVQEAIALESAGVASLWFPSGGTAGDPMIAMSLAGRATQRLEVAAGVLQTFPCHPVLMVERIASLAASVDRPVTIGLGPSHRELVEYSYGVSYDHAGRHTEEYLKIVAPLLNGEKVRFTGEDLTARFNPPVLTHRPSLLLAALAPRMLRVAGTYTDGTALWLTTPKAIEELVMPPLTKAAQAAGRPSPRVVAGLLVAVHDDVDEAADALIREGGVYGMLSTYKRVMEQGGARTLADACAIGNERTVAARFRALIDAGATDIRASVIPVGASREASVARTIALLAELSAAGSE